jgi:Uncharacterized protein conserved in bacteria
MEKPLVNKKYLLEKFPGKGGWTFTFIPEIPPDKHSPFGFMKVKGSIDGYEIKHFHLLPSVKGDDRLFLTVKAEIRKAIKKEAGDYVHIILYPDNDPIEIPEELIICLKDESDVYEKFQQLKESEQRAFVDWIYAAKTAETKVKRIAVTIDKVLKGHKFTDKTK